MALFDNDKAVFRQYIPVVVNFSLEPLLPYLDQTAGDVLPRFLGEALTTQLLGLVAALENQEKEDRMPVLVRALDLTRRAVAGICVAERLPLLEVQIGSDGVTVSAADGRRPAFEYQTTKVQKVLADAGWQALDKLIALIDKHPAHFPDWEDAPYYEEYQDSLFKSAAEFSRYYGIQDRWLTFWALCPHIRAIQEGQAATVQARIDAIAAELISSDQRNRLHRGLLRAVAYQAVIDAIPTLSIELNGANIQVNYSGQFANNSYTKAPDSTHLDWVRQNLQKQTDIAWTSVENAIAELITVPLPGTTPTTSLTGTGWLNDDDSKLILF